MTASSITGATTCAELEMAKVVLGISYLTLRVGYEAKRTIYAHASTASGLFADGEGSNEADALEACFESLRAKIARQLRRTNPVSSSK
jgi:hypothetical protein